MSLSDLVQEKNALLIELECAKSTKAKRTIISTLASKAAVLEAEIAALLLTQGKRDKAVINLISQASCYLDAKREAEAARILEMALAVTQIKETRHWIQTTLTPLSAARRVGVLFSSLRTNISENTDLRRPQRECYRAAHSHFSQSDEHAIIQLPVGCGKTGAMSILPFGLAKGRVLVVAPNLEIRKNLTKNFDYSNPICFWRKRHVLLNGQAPTCAELDSDASVLDCDNSDLVVTNIQQLVANDSEKWLKIIPPDYFDMILIDEAHHNVAPSWQQVIERFSSAKVASFTATPLRSDGKVVEGKRIYRFPISDAIKEGFIKDLASRKLTPSEIYFEYKGQKKRHTLEEVLALREEAWFSKGVALSPECNKNIVDASIQCMNELRANSAQQQQIIAVSCSIDHANSIRSLYVERGCRAEVLHSHQTEAEQDRIRSVLTKGEIDVIVQVQMLGEGADYPKLSVAAIFRPYRRLVPYVQFVGRIMRVLVEDSPGHPDNKGFVVSHVGLNVDRWWEDLRKIDDDDQGFFQELAEGERGFLLEGGAIQDNPQARRRFSPEMKVLEETIAYFVQESLLPEDKKALIDDLINALALRGVTIETLGLSREQLEEKYLEAHTSQQIGKHENLPVQPQAARQEARKRLDERVRSGAKQLLNDLGISVVGFELPRRYPSFGAANNLAAAVILLNREVQIFLGVGGGDRRELTEEELKRAHDNIDILIDRLVRAYREEKPK